MDKLMVALLALGGLLGMLAIGLLCQSLILFYSFNYVVVYFLGCKTMSLFQSMLSIMLLNVMTSTINKIDTKKLFNKQEEK